MTETDIWAKWENQIVNGAYPLRRFLGRSSHSVVFLTEYRAQDIADAAIKLVPADPALTESQLAQWKMAAALSHPHLLRLFDAGQCQLGGHAFLFVVMEYAEQTLAQILPHRALSADEARQLLTPVLDALGFLHGRHLVQGALKPPNVLVVNDQVKLASDTIRNASREVGTPDDILALGATLAEALTQQSAPMSSAYLPAEFANTIRRCMNGNAAERPTVAELSEAPASAPACVPDSSAARSVGKKRLAIPALARIGAGAILILGIWASVHLLHGAQAPAERAAAPAAAPPQPAAAADSTIGSPSSLVTHQEIPDVSGGARQSIQGTIKVTVRVTVDASGNVIAESLENRGPSNYFARLASEAAKRWTFAPMENQDSRRLLLEFAFSRAGASARVVGHRS